MLLTLGVIAGAALIGVGSFVFWPDNKKSKLR